MSKSTISQSVKTSVKAVAWGLVLAVSIILVIEVFNLPTSVQEAKFRWKINSQAASNTPQINLADIVEGGWELVCDSHGYGGPTRVSKYNRVYPPVGESQDNHWGLIFISPDGSYLPITGHCSKTSPDIYVRGCLEKENAVLYKQPTTKSDSCARYESVTEEQKKEEN